MAPEFRTTENVFLSGDNALTRNYLRFLVERITVTDQRIDLTARSESAVQMIAAADVVLGVTVQALTFAALKG